MRQAGQDDSRGCDDGDRHAETRRGRDRMMDRLAVEREHDVGQRTAAHAHQRTGKPDGETVERHRHGIGRSVPRFQRSPANRNLVAMKPAITHEGDLEHRRRREAAIAAPQGRRGTAGSAQSGSRAGMTRPFSGASNKSVRSSAG